MKISPPSTFITIPVLAVLPILLTFLYPLCRPFSESHILPYEGLGGMYGFLIPLCVW